jgi:hypothetical protein
MALFAERQDFEVHVSDSRHSFFRMYMEVIPKRTVAFLKHPGQILYPFSLIHTKRYTLLGILWTIVHDSMLALSPKTIRAHLVFRKMLFFLPSMGMRSVSGPDAIPPFLCRCQGW